MSSTGYQPNDPFVLANSFWLEYPLGIFSVLLAQPQFQRVVHRRATDCS
jgi:hypothetical protein